MKRGLLGLLFFATLTISQFALAFEFNIGDVVISQNGWRGVVRGVFNDGRVSVYYSGSSAGVYIQNPATLARTYGSEGDLTVGDQVISANGWMGEIHGIYMDGQVSVYYAGSSQGRYRTNPDLLARTRGMSGGFRIGDHVLSRNGWRGVVQGIYPDGTLSVYYAGSSQGRYRQSPSQLARTRP